MINWLGWLDYLEDVLIPQWDIEAKSGRLSNEEWDVLRKAALRRDGYMCQGCSHDGIALDVHHIVPINRGGNNWLQNLISLCRQCHKRIHAWI
jgi:5-methylcytosine-specific restriction endonuclease McrA